MSGWGADEERGSGGRRPPTVWPWRAAGRDRRESGLLEVAGYGTERQAPSPSSGLPGDAGWLPPAFLTVTEAAAKLSGHRSAVLRMVHAGKLRSVRLGRSYRIPEAEQVVRGHEHPDDRPRLTSEPEALARPDCFLTAA